MDLFNLNIISQNVNSLNLSTGIGNQIFWKKILSILKHSPDIVFLQDIRLGDKSKYFSSMLKATKFGNFNVFTASQKAHRGVCIIFKTCLDLKILETIYDDNDNFLLIHAELNKKKILLGSIYSPTYNECPSFLVNLEQKIRHFGNIPTIIGGDFNAITSNIVPDQNHNLNPDLFFTDHIPNKKNSETLIDWISEDFLYDAFRVIHPDKKEYSYIPFRASAQRSRIDHFFISEHIIPTIHEVSYSLPEGNFFDHKMVHFKSKRECIKPISINTNDLDSPLIKETVHLSTLNTIDDYLIIDTTTSALLQDIRILHHQAFICLKLYYKTNDLLLYQIALNLINELNIQFQSTASVEELLENKSTISHSCLLKMLCNNILHSVNSLQKAFNCAKNSRLTRLKEKLDVETLQCNRSNIQLLEAEIKSHQEKKLEEICKNNRKWSVLNLEKPSKVFCAIASKSKKSDNISLIKPPGNQTNPPIKLDDYINNFFDEIYSPKPSIGEINDFLCNDALIDLNKRKLSPSVSDNLDQPLKISELDEVIKKCNLYSAPGHDGFNFKFINKFWSIFRLFIFNAAKEWIEQGEIFDDFNLSKIKLIPKKENLSLLTNWRPISLLSCFYKIFSGAIANRFKSVIDSITSIQQKAYSSLKNIGEVLITLNNSIYMSIVNDIDLAAITIDFKKAFDFISHLFLVKVLKFYNFGPYFIKMCTTTFKKFAFIDGLGTSKKFQISSGVAQGDSISGFLFLLAIDILITNLMYKPEILHATYDKSQNPHNIISPKVVAYADDLTLLINPTHETITSILQCLNDFKHLSGLECNLNKTSITPIYLNPQNSLSKNIPFKIKNNFEVLGMVFSSNLQSSYEKNFTKILEKMAKTISFWQKINLSLVGRITIAKTYLVSFLSYLGPHLSITDEHFKMIDSLICDFVRNKLRISRDKVFSPVIFGGLGIPSSVNFVTALRLNFYKKSLRSNDMWATLIKQSRTLNMEYLHDVKSLSLKPLGSILIIDAFQVFKKNFFTKPENMLECHIFLNPMINLNNDVFHPLSAYSTIRSHDELINICRLKLKHFFDHDREKIFTPDEFNRRECLDLKPDVIKNIITACKKMFQSFIYPPRPVNLSQLFKIKKTKSKHFRHYLETSDFKYYKSLNKPAFTRMSKFDFPLEKNNEYHLNSCWNLSFLPANIREFIYKFLNFNLPMNANLAHFVQNNNPSCLNCVRTKCLPPPKETYEHFFLHCDLTNLILNEIFENNSTMSFSTILFSPPDLNKQSFYCRVLLLCAFFHIFRNRNSPNSVKIENIHEHFLATVKLIKETSKKFAKFIDVRWLNNKIILSPFPPSIPNDGF